MAAAKKTKKKSTKTVALEADLHTELKVRAVRKQMDLTVFINEILRDYLVRNLSEESAALKKEP